MLGTKRLMRAALALLATFSLIAVPLRSSANLICDSAKGVAATWKCLGQPHPIYPFGRSAVYYRSLLTNHSTLNLVVVDLNSRHWTLRAVVNSSVDNVTSTARRYHASIAVNGGYFDSRSKKSVSFVVDEGSLVSTPRLDPKFAKFLPQILNRSELREVVGEDGKEKFTIAPHYAPIPAGAAIEESLQAGPELLPDYSPQREAFKRTLPNGRRIDAIGSTSTANRSALGITSFNKLIIISVTDDATNPDAGGATLVELADILESLGAVEAVNLDGGSSTTMYVRFADGGKKWHESVVANASRMRLIKSALLLCPDN
jgi:hypothetical protein